MSPYLYISELLTYLPIVIISSYRTWRAKEYITVVVGISLIKQPSVNSEMLFCDRNSTMWEERKFQKYEQLFSSPFEFNVFVRKKW